MKMDLDPVDEVREWRKEVMKSWQGKDWEMIRQALNERGEQFMREAKEGVVQKKTGAA